MNLNLEQTSAGAYPWPYDTMERIHCIICMDVWRNIDRYTGILIFLNRALSNIVYKLILAVLMDSEQMH